jgi:hypothetical protein
MVEVWSSTLLVHKCLRGFLHDSSVGQNDIQRLAPDLLLTINNGAPAYDLIGHTRIRAGQSARWHHQGPVVRHVSGIPAKSVSFAIHSRSLGVSLLGKSLGATREGGC